MTSPEVRIISSMATRRLLADLIAAFAATSSQRVSVESVGGVDAAKRVVGGEPFDVVVLASGALDALAAQGSVVPGSRVDVAKSPVAIAVRAGAPRPSIGSEEDVRRAVQAAHRIGYSTGPSGDHLVTLVERWGLGDADADRLAAQGHRPPQLVRVPSGVPVATLVARGDVDLGFQQLSELMEAESIEVLGVLPPAIQHVTTFSAGLTRVSPRPEQIRPLLAFLGSPAVAEIKRRHGMEPA